MVKKFVSLHLYDILIFSTSLQEHVHVLQQLLENQLYDKTEKCEFQQDTISFFFLMSVGKLEMDLSRVKVELGWPQPITWKKIQKFLGFTIY